MNLLSQRRIRTLVLMIWAIATNVMHPQIIDVASCCTHRNLRNAVSLWSLPPPLCRDSCCLSLGTAWSRFLCVCCGSIGQLRDFDSVCLACAWWAMKHDYGDSGVNFVVDPKYLLSSISELRFRRWILASILLLSWRCLMSTFSFRWLLLWIIELLLCK